MTPLLTEKHIKDTCKPSTIDCCAFLVMGMNGFQCAKGTDLEPSISQRLFLGMMRATGNNCEGVSDATTD